LLAPPSASDESPFGLKDDKVRAVLHEGLQVLGELGRSFNDSVFEEYIKPGPSVT
jgi:hypothetical protein